MTSNDRTEPGVCPECNGDRRGVYAYGCWYTCDACKGTGQQPSALDKYNTDLGHRLREAGVGQQPAQPFDPLRNFAEWCLGAPEEVGERMVRHIKDNARAALAQLAQPGSGEELVERLLADELCPQHGQIIESECVACELVKALRALTTAQRDRNAQYDRAQRVSEHNSRLWSEREALRDKLTTAQQRYADGLEAWKANNAHFAARIAELREAGQAVVDRWDTPLWKDVPATAEYINRLRALLTAVERDFPENSSG